MILFSAIKGKTLFRGKEYSSLKGGADRIAMIVVNLDVMMARRKMSLGELAEKVDITPQNLSVLKNGRGKALRFSTLDALCRALQCQPGDILEYGTEGEP